MDINNLIYPIYHFFVTSHDFNGITDMDLFRQWNVGQIEGYRLLIKLVHLDVCTIQSSSNPHIIYNGLPTKDQAISLINKMICGEKGSMYPICVYPTPTYLKNNRKVDNYSSYAKRMALGFPQMKPLFFDFEVLHSYLNNPKYTLRLKDYYGSLSYTIETDNLVDKSGYYKLETFGLGYNQDDIRVIVSFPRYLNRLSPSQQTHWESYELTSQCKILSAYMDNIISGRWCFPKSLASGVLNERSRVNKLWECIFEDNLFLNDFSLDQLPANFSFLFIPTQKSLMEFYHLMDKLFSDDINIKHLRLLLKSGFENLPPVTETYDENIGSLNALKLWMDNIYHLKNGIPIGNEIVAPLKKVRKLRQSPAHKILTENCYDKNVYELQNNILEDIYDSLKKLRIILSTHPKARQLYCTFDTDDMIYRF